MIRVMKNVWRNLLIVVLLLILPGAAQALLGSLEPEVGPWAGSHGLSLKGTQRGTEGCLQGKRYVLAEGSGVKMYAVFFHPGYGEESGNVTQAIFEFDPPVSRDKATQWAIKIAPIIGTRPPTHTQEVKPNPKDPCIPGSGGKEGRWTDDWIVEWLSGSGGQVSRMRVYNDYIR